MQFKFGTPTEPGRYDCVFDNDEIFSNCVRQLCNFVKAGDSIEAFTSNGYPINISEIVQYLGPFPDPLPEPLKPFRRFNVTDSDGHTGTGSYNPHAGKANTCLTIHWVDNDYACCFYLNVDDPNLTIDWIDEEPHD